MGHDLPVAVSQIEQVEGRDERSLNACAVMLLRCDRRGLALVGSARPCLFAQRREPDRAVRQARSSPSKHDSSFLERVRGGGAPRNAGP